MLYKLIVGSTRLQNEDGEWVNYQAWDNNIVNLTPLQAKSLGRRVTPLVETEGGETVEAIVQTPRRRSVPRG